VEVATRRRLGIDLQEGAVPVRDAVRGACEMLGLDPLLVANEGKLMVFVPEPGAEAVLAAMRRHPLGRDAARIGHVTREHAGRVVAETPLGTRRVIDLPLSEPLPRIC
jgi:hydrogenase expression/formation protein HypE